MADRDTTQIPVDLSVVTDDGRVAIEVRNNGTEVVLDLEVIAGFDRHRATHARTPDGEVEPVDRLDPGESVVLLVDEAEVDDDGLRALVAYHHHGRTHRAVTKAQRVDERPRIDDPAA